MEFMDGVTIIKECTDNSAICAIMIIPSMIAAALGTGIIKIAEKLVHNKIIATIVTISGLAFTLICVITMFLTTQMDKFQKPNGKYEVTISSDIDMNEFQSKYNIIDYDNGVYTVKSKDNVPQPSFNTHKETTEEATTQIDGKIYKITPIE